MVRKQQLPGTNFRLPMELTTSRIFGTTDSFLTSFLLPLTHYFLLITYYQWSLRHPVFSGLPTHSLPLSSYLLLLTSFSLPTPTTNYRLPTTYYLLLLTHSSFLTSHLSPLTSVYVQGQRYENQAIRRINIFVLIGVVLKNYKL